MRQTAATTQRQNTANRKTLEDIQNKLIYLREEIQKDRSARAMSYAPSCLTSPCRG